MNSFHSAEGRLSGIISTQTWVIEYNSKFAGKAHYLTSGTKDTRRREKNTAILYAPGCIFKEDTRKAELPLKETYLRFKGGELGGLDSLTGTRTRYCYFIDRDNRIGRILEECAGLCAEKNEEAFWQVQSLLMKFICLANNFSNKVSADTYEITGKFLSSNTFIEDAEHFMKRNILSNIKNSDIAAHLNLSESTFSHKFKKISGSPPRTRILEIKIDIAKEMLLKGKKLKEIAEFVGFHDEFHLSKTFKNITGISPKNFTR